MRSSRPKSRIGSNRSNIFETSEADLQHMLDVFTKPPLKRKKSELFRLKEIFNNHQFFMDLEKNSGEEAVLK